MKRKLLIFGSTGFIGRNAAEILSENDNFEVYGTYNNSEPLTNPKIRMIRADLTNKEDVDNAVKGKDIVIQAAATTSGAKDITERPYRHVTDNAVMNALILRSVYDSNAASFIFLSCTTMYRSSDLPVKESDFSADEEMNSKYFGGAWTKVYNEKMCEFFSRIGSTKYTVVRHSNIYGPYDKFDLERSHVFGATITKVMTASDGGKIIVWGNGEEERDLLHVYDLVSFFERVIEKQNSRFELFNAGSGSSVSIRELVKKIIVHSEKTLNVEYDLTKPTIKTKICLDSTKAEKMLEWRAKISLDEGIKKTLKWYENNIVKV